MVTIRGIPNLVPSLPSIKVTNRICEERSHRWVSSCSWDELWNAICPIERCTDIARRHCEFCVAVERSSRDKSQINFLCAWRMRFEPVEIILASVPAYDQWSLDERHTFSRLRIHQTGRAQQAPLQRRLKLRSFYRIGFFISRITSWNIRGNELRLVALKSCVVLSRIAPFRDNPFTVSFKSGLIQRRRAIAIHAKWFMIVKQLRPDNEGAKRCLRSEEADMKWHSVVYGYV